MHRIGAEQAVEIARRDALDSGRNCTGRFDEAPLGILGEQQALDAPGRIFQRRFDGVKAKEPKWTFGVVCRACSARIPMRRLGAGLRAVPAGGEAGRALFFAPWLVETFVWQGLPRIWLGL